MSLGKKIFLTVGVLVVVISMAQGILTTGIVKGHLQQGAVGAIEDQAQGMMDTLADLLTQAEADLQVMGAHTSIADFLTFQLFADPDGMGAEVDRLELFFTRVVQAKSRYRTLQMVGIDGPVLQLTNGRRREQFKAYDYQAAQTALKQMLESDGFGLIHRLNRQDDTLTLVSVMALENDGEIEGMLWLEQPIDHVLETLWAKLSRQASLGVVVEPDGTLIAHSPGLGAGMLEQLQSGDSNDWVKAEKTLVKLDWRITLAKQRSEAFAVVNRLAISVVAIVVVSLIAVISVLGGAINFFVTRPLDSVTASLKDIAQGRGDLTVRLPVGGKDEMGQLAGAFNSFVAKISATIIDVKATVGELKSQAERLDEVIAVNSNNMGRQQDETAQVVAATTQMAATSHEVARVTQDAAELTRAASNESAQGSQVVKRAIEAIEQLAADVDEAAGVVQQVAEDSENINTILEVIRGVAEQTNLLALNAAIEAARAGDQGRGFAVVADEVRQLAQNTQQSTLEIHGIIERLQAGSGNAATVMGSSRSKASASVDNANHTAASFEHIAEAVNRLNAVNLQIANAAEEQGLVTDGVNRNISMINETMQEAAQSAQVTANTAHALSDVAGRLEKTVGQFKV